MFALILAQSAPGLTFNTFNAVVYTVCFLVLGFLIDLTLSRFFYKKSEQVTLILLIFLTLSCLNYIPWISVYLLPWNRSILENPSFLAFAFIIIIFISPVLIGLTLGYVNQKQLLERGLSSLGFKTITGFPSAWDYSFSRIEEPVWVLITLKDGSQIAGWFGKNSLASSELSERDIYLELVYKLEDDAWQPVARSAGILINAEEIRYIEFWQDQTEVT
ncbi:DUF6338 family protein [Microcystis aeruginosa CS-563/04]|jgi:hypothetical protein|uniref:DUF6338 family protein n=1 Tax=Microcystis aeruginosa TaxID=1126 RepID=UPI002330BE03|nr:DUF6338 family protein [Microcystis aeruginosa]MDB9420596.1 DUF6338 family protein [Microcystis aeruginosa CS-563/04]NCR07526.1 hypothetical protein [Microcystis aeruginosa LG13-11]